MRPTALAVRTLSAAAALTIVACSRPDSVTSVDGLDAGALMVSILPKLDTVATGAIRQLSVRVTDRNGIPSTTRVDWKSDNASVASVSTTGLVTAIAEGSARIIAAAGSRADTATIVVRTAAASLLVVPDRVSIASGDTLPLTASATAGMSGAFGGAGVRWSTSDSSIATVSDNGVVTTLDAGNVTVTAELGTATGTALFAVFKNQPVALQVSPTITNVAVGGVAQLKVTAQDADGRKVNVRTLTWTSSDSSIASVASNGQVKAKTKGMAVISASIADVRGSATVNVQNAAISTVAVSLTAASISVGQTTQATAVLTAVDGSIVTDRIVAWQSSNPAIVTVDATGLVKGIALGTATISAISDGQVGSAAISVTASQPASLQIVPATASATVGSTAQLVAELKDSNGALITDKPVTWSSSNTSVATVNGSGLVTSLAIGNATISASSSGLASSAAFTATAVAVASITASPTSSTLDVGQTAQLTAVVRGVNGETLTDRPVVWASADPAIATVSQRGVVTAIASGSTTVTAAVEGQTASVAVSVKALPPPPIATISVTLNAASVLVGQSTQAVAVTKDAAGNVLEGRQITWSSNDPSLATVNSSGVITAIAAGSVTILASAEGKVGAATLRIDLPAPAPVASVVLTAPTTALLVGASTQVVATLRDSTGKILSGRTITWSSSAPAVAAVGATGLVTAMAAGTATIRATSESVVGSLNFSVTAPAPQPVAVATVSVSLTQTSLTVGSTTQASATPRDAAGNVLTGRTVSWSSSNAAVATVSAAGLVSALSVGSVTVTANVEGKTGSAAATVSAPVSGTTIYPGQSIQAAVDAAPGGTAFVLKAGVHRMQSVVPKAGDTFSGEPGAVLNGSRLLTAFTRSGSYWVATGQTQEGTNQSSASGICRAGYERCIYPWDVFRDGVPLRAATSLAGLASGGFYFDFANDAIYVADDPAGHTTEAAVTQRAFGGTASNVTIQGLVIEKYANFLQQGVIDPTTAPSWVVQDNEVRLNHGEGVRIGPNARILRNNIHHMGMVGVAGFANGALVEGNEIAFNNYAGVNDEWAAGGLKVNGRSGGLVQDLTIRNNRVHDNVGRGLWCDYNCIRTVYEGNTVERNTSWGIEQEIGYAATISANTLNGNGGGIFVSTSQDVEVAGNTINGPYAILGLEEVRGTGYYGALVLKNMNVHDNVVTLPVGAGDNQHVGIIQTNGDNGVFSTANNRFTNNRYTLNGVQRPFAWMSAYRTATEWRGFGLDATGSFAQ